MIVMHIKCPACGFRSSQVITVHNINNRLACPLCVMRFIAARVNQSKRKGVYCGK